MCPLANTHVCQEDIPVWDDLEARWQVRLLFRHKLRRPERSSSAPDGCFSLPSFLEETYHILLSSARPEEAFRFHVVQESMSKLTKVPKFQQILPIARFLW